MNLSSAKNRLQNSLSRELEVAYATRDMRSHVSRALTIDSVWDAYHAGVAECPDTMSDGEKALWGAGRAGYMIRQAERGKVLEPIRASAAATPRSVSPQYDSPEEFLLDTARVSPYGYQVLPALRAAWLRATRTGQDPRQRVSDLAQRDLRAVDDMDLLPTYDEKGHTQ